MNESLEFLDPADGARTTMLPPTLLVLRRRRLGRRAAALLVVALAYAGGFATHALRASRVPDAPPDAGRAVLDAPSPAVPLPAEPGDIESRAVAASSEAERATLLRSAGDRYLGDLGDVEAALRCYRELLKHAPSTELSRFDPADTWLLAALKRGSI